MAYINAKFVWTISSRQPVDGYFSTMCVWETEVTNHSSSAPGINQPMPRELRRLARNSDLHAAGATK